MASGKVYNPLALLRIAPLVSSTCSLWFALDQHFFLSIFNKPVHRSKSNDLLPSYFTFFFHNGVVRVIVLIAASIGTALGNIYNGPGSSQGPRQWYIAGAALTASHLLFVPAVGPRIQAIIHDRSRGHSTDELQRWLRVHLVRTVTVDLAAWVCFIVAVIARPSLDHSD
ncbi:hypothetical protein F5884DRAFT_778171 [Xylogone sp. PMI_703]|nr:hypothetical protein F5884DRAFT_778171 [Xylogone sp. PMI_703]